MGRKYYLIDTENVGDRWFEMLQKTRKKDKIITFYTEHHSKHLEKYLAKQVHNPKILWLECAAGVNALDYQLMGVLSYLIAKHPKASFCIYSNDKDYQGAVDFWKTRGIDISQKGFKMVKKKKSKKKKVKGKLAEKQYVEKIAESIPLSDLGGWYQTLVVIFGQKKGHNWYLKVRDNVQLRTELSKHCMGDKHLRNINLIAMVLKLSKLDEGQAEAAYTIIHSHDRKDLKTMKAEFDKKFGTKPQQQYYKALRPLFRVIKGK